ncbi:AAA family ATPase [Thermoactinospora rubra]|uniref:bifunctional aminoglycoside phosphotransferase/ATP-binding protein n=1 Tax=Thermoactinospora rubra TaxID=1088767 RepID=UPI000A118844|nr:bifunctional aminoglycoside phosphotransferase/ATP-binding protein [Thermoactinospora rubra]
MSVDLKETHVAVVFLVGDRAYKLKKPVNLSFLDFTTRQARQAACQEEVELNRRLAPDVYEGVADVLGPDGEPCDHLVVMRRMPEERRLATLVRTGKPVDDHLRDIARLVAGLHAKARHGPQIDRQGGREALRGRWADSFAQVRGLPGAPVEPRTVDETERLTLRFLDGRAPLFDSRIAEGRVVDGHGDLLAEDIFCLDDGPRILDCLEFDERLRFLDGLDDAAFLAMDLERLGAPRLAELFLRWYVEFSGDPAPPTLWHHYLAYRAFVRAKVACLRHWQGEAEAGWEARQLAGLTLRHLRAGAVTLVMVGGSPGTGKTTLAGAVADRLGHTLLSSDRIRKELAGLDPLQPAAAPYQEGIYSPEHTERTYAELLARAETLLGLGEPVVLDASWTGERHRAMAADVAGRTHSDLVALRCTVMPQIAAERLAGRRPGASDADAAIAEVVRSAASPWPDAVEIDTGAPLEQALDRALAAVHPPEREISWRFRRPQMEPD